MNHTILKKIKRHTKHGLRPFYRVAQRVCTRMISSSLMSMQHEINELRNLLNDVTRRKMPTIEPTRCLKPFTFEEVSLEERRNARQRLGLPPEQIVFIIPGRLDIDNGIEECLTILAALEQVNYWGGEVHLYFLYPTSAEMLSLIQTHSDRLDLVPQIHLTDHIVEEREYRDFLIAVDGAIHLSRTVHGGYSGTLADCVSAGLPTVCNENLAPLWYGLTYVNIVPDSMSPLLLAGRIWDIAIAAIEHLKDETFRSRNVKEHGQFNHATQIIKLLLAS